MKQLLAIIAFLFISVAAQAQKPWMSMGIDSSEFVEQYGTEQDYALQESYRLSSDRRDGYRVVLIGQKMYWYNQLSIYMQAAGYSPNDDDRMIGDEMRFSYTENGAIGRRLSKFNVAIKLDKDGRMMQINITGDADPLSEMFIGYWGMYGISANELKSKGIITNAFASDRITFDWKGAKPVIRIRGGA